MLYVMAAKVQALCIYCLGSAFLSVSLFGMTLVGHRWIRLKGLTLIGILIASVVLLGGIGVHANVEQVAQTPSSGAIALEPQGEPSPGVGWKVTTPSGEAERQLAQHLKKVGAKEYTAWWCPHCHEQKALFGKDAYTELPNVECDPDGKNAKPAVCDAAKVEGFPTWDIKGQRLVGPQSLEKLAKVSGYKGSQDFRNKIKIPQ
jgi:protein-disulfide isomerase